MNNLPNLSEWHEVPAGATIPANTPYYRMMPTGNDSFFRNGQPDDRAPEDRHPDGTYYTKHKIEAPKQTLEDVIRDGIVGRYAPAQIAKAVEAFYAEQPKVIIDDDDDEWRLNAAGTYDVWYDDERIEQFANFTRERIKSAYGIKEEHY